VFFLPLSFLLLIIFILLLPVLFFLIQIGIIGAAFAKLGLSPKTAFLILIFSLLGSMINIPIVRRGVYGDWISPFSFGEGQAICVNLGGAIIPLLLCIYLFPKVPLKTTVIVTLIMIVISKLLTRVVPGVGFTIPALIPPLIAAFLAIILSSKNPASVAYISGVLGILIGSDLLNLYQLQAVGAPMISIGGAGVYDGIFLVGIISALLTF